jgi:hypothetical protein
LKRTPAGAPSSPAAQAARPPVETVLKWIAAIAAILSLIAGTFQVTRLFSDVSERKRFINESVEVARQQGASGNMAAAWSTLDAALKSADEGGQFAKLTGQLSTERQHLRIAQEELAMRWLREMRATGGRSFSDVVDKLLPVLDRGAAAATGTAKADRLAHVGWGYFLKVRDGAAGLNPESQYRAALEVDAENPYAHAFWGHWMLWNGGPFAAALAHFEAAVKPAATRAEARAFELAALRNASGARATAQWLLVVDQMRRGGENLSPAIVNDVYHNYRRVVIEGALPPEFLAAMPADEQIDLITTLCQQPDADADRANMCKAAQAMVREAAGDRVQALALWREVRAAANVNEVTLRARAETAIRQLQAAPGTPR